MDANGDGKIVMEEAQAFGMVAANVDGGIDHAETQTIADFMSNQ